MLLNLIGTALCASSFVYALVALLARAPRATQPTELAASPGVSVLKPLCGLEPCLESNLETLCLQSHPRFQILCGVRDPDDGAVAVVRRLQRRYPRCALELIVDARVAGLNPKVSNLANLLEHARYEWIVIADSDIAVEADYLEKVTAPLSDPSVGVVTCLYQGRSNGAFWSRLGALFINSWFVPSVRVAHALGSRDYGFGATIAVRREALAAIGEFEALRNRLADDYWLARLVRETGLTTVLSHVAVTTDVPETRLGDLWRREVRWLRTIRSLNPWGFAFSFVTFTLPVAAFGLALAPTPLNLALAALAATGRLTLQLRPVAPGFAPAGGLRLAFLRDFMLLAGWAYALVGSHVHWRQRLIALANGPGQPLS